MMNIVSDKEYTEVLVISLFYYVSCYDDEYFANLRKHARIIDIVQSKIEYDSIKSCWRQIWSWQEKR